MIVTYGIALTANRLFHNMIFILIYVMLFVLISINNCDCYTINSLLKTKHLNFSQHSITVPEEAWTDDSYIWYCIDCQ